MSLRIRTIARLTGVRESTLRAWERRYGFPRPARSEANNYRSYSESELEAVHQVVRLMSEGYSASEAIAKALGRSDPGPVAARRVRELEQAVVALDCPRILQVVAAAESDLGPLSLCLHVLEPVLLSSALVGGKVHELAYTLLRQPLMKLWANHRPMSRGEVVIACATGDSCEALALLIATQLRLSGAQAQFYGGETSPGLLRLILAREQTRMLVLGFADPVTPEALEKLVGQIVTRPGPAVFLGGSGVLPHQALIEKLGLGLIRSPEEVRAQVQQMGLFGPAPLPEAESTEALQLAGGGG